MRVAITADLHWGTRHTDGNEATLVLAGRLAGDPPDLLILAGDVGAGDDFAGCLALFEKLPCRKALVPGNHDVWVLPDDERGDSLHVYDHHLPRLCEGHGFCYLDSGPMVLADEGVALVGTMNWYDHSWAIDALREGHPDHLWRLESKRFTRGRHNDANFVRWDLDDAGFTARCVAEFERYLDEALSRVPRAVVVAHHPPFRALNYPKPEPKSLDDLLWEAFSGNAAMEGLLRARADRVPLAFCGHTHFARQGEFHGVRGFNVGGDYTFKRLLRLDWPSGEVTAEEFRPG